MGKGKSPNGNGGSCTLDGCSWAIVHGELGCASGGSDCFQCKFVNASPSEFHDQALIDATGRINEILDAIPKDKGGRKLSLILTRQGFLLAWVRHGAASRQGVVTSKDGDAAVAKALGLKAERRRRAARR